VIYLKAFIIGGLICMICQILLEKTKMMPGRVMVLLVCLGSVLSFFGIYDFLCCFAVYIFKGFFKMFFFAFCAKTCFVD